MLECMIIHYMDGTLSQVYKFLSGIMPGVVVLHGFLVLTMFYVTAGSFSTNDQQLIAAYLLPSIYPSSRRLMCPEVTRICPGKQMNVRFGKQIKIQCLSHTDCASQKICCWSNCWSKYSCQDPVFIVKLEGHSEYLQEDFQTNVNGKYEIALPCETCNEVTAQNWTYSANDAQILEIKDKHSKVKRAATKNTPKAKKKPKPKPNVTKTNKELAKNIKTVPKVTKKIPPAKSKYQKRKTTTKTSKKKLSKNKKKPLKSTSKKSSKPTKQITINAKTSKTMENSDETERKKIIKAKPTNEMALATVKRVQPTNKTALTTVKRTKATKKIALTTVKLKKTAYKMALTIVRSTNPTKKIALTTVKIAKTTKETIPSATKEEIPSVKATQNHSTKNFYGLFKIKTKQKIPENGVLLGSTNKFRLLEDFNKNILLDKYQGVFPIKSRTNEVNSTGKLFKLEEEQNSTTEIVTRTKVIKKTALTTVTQPTNKMTMKTSKRTKPTYKMTLTTIKLAKPTNKTTLTTVKKTRPTKKMALTTVSKAKPTNKMTLTIMKRTKPTNKTTLTTVKRTKSTKKMSLTTVKRTKPTVETILSVTKEKIPAVEKATQNNSTKNFYGPFKIKTKQKIPENGEVLGSTKKFPLLQDFNENTIMEKYQGALPIKSRTNVVDSTGRLFKLEEQNSTKEILKRTKLTKKTALTTATKPTNKITIKTIKKTKPTNKMTLTTIKIAKPTNKTSMTTVKKTRPTKKMVLTTVKKAKPTNKMTLTIIKRTKPSNKTTLITVKRTKPTKKMSLTTVKRTKPTVETILSVTKENITAVEKAPQNNSSKNFYGPFKIKKKQKLPENVEVLGTTTRKFSLLQEFSGNTFVDKYQGVYPVKPRKNESISTGKLFKLEEQRNHTRETVKRTKPTKELAIKPTKKTSLTAVKRTKPTKELAIKPTKKTSLTAVKRTKPTTKMALATVKRTKPTKEKISTVPKEEIPVVEKVTQNNSIKNFYGLFKIKTKQKIPQNGEVLGSTKKFPFLQDFNENTFMNKYQGVFPIKSRTNEVISAGRLFKLEEEQNSTTESVKRIKLTKKTALTTLTKPTNKMTMKSIKRTKPTNKMTLTTIKITKPTNKTAMTTVKRTKPTKKMSLTTVKRTKPTVETLLSVTKGNIPAVEKATQSKSSKNFYGPFKIKKKQKLPENGEVLGTTTRKFSLLQEFRGNTFVDKYQGVYPVKPRKNEATSTGKLFNLEEQRNHTRETVKRTKTTKKLVTKPTKKTSLTAVKRTKPTKKMALATVKRTKPTMETISTVAKEEITVVEKVTQNNSTKNFYGLFKIKTKQKLPEYSEVLVTTIRNFPPLPVSNGNTLMSKYQGVFTLLLLLLNWPVLWTR